jgi:hypothetical protein
MKNKTTNELINEITESQMIYNIHQVQHILNHLISGKKYDGSKLDQEKLINYKLSLVKIIDKNKTKMEVV